MICNNELEALGIKRYDTRVFDYFLNKKKAKVKLRKGTKRENLEVEIKNLLISDGAYFELVLPLMKLWKTKVNEVFVVNETIMKVTTNIEGFEESKAKMDVMEEKLKKIDDSLMDTKVAMSNENC